MVWEEYDRARSLKSRSLMGGDGGRMGFRRDEEVSVFGVKLPRGYPTPGRKSGERVAALSKLHQSGHVRRSGGLEDALCLQRPCRCLSCPAVLFCFEAIVEVTAWIHSSEKALLCYVFVSTMVNLIQTMCHLYSCTNYIRK